MLYVVINSSIVGGRPIFFASSELYFPGSYGRPTQRQQQQQQRARSVGTRCVAALFDLGFLRLVLSAL